MLARCGSWGSLRPLTIFEAAFEASAIVITKDSDFARLSETLGDGPQIVWLTCGNTSNLRLREILSAVWPRLMPALNAGSRVLQVHDEHSLEPH